MKYTATTCEVCGFIWKHLVIEEQWECPRCGSEEIDTMRD